MKYAFLFRLTRLFPFYLYLLNNYQIKLCQHNTKKNTLFRMPIRKSELKKLNLSILYIIFTNSPFEFYS